MRALVAGVVGVGLGVGVLGSAAAQPVVNVPEEPFPSLEFFAANPGTRVIVEGPGEDGSDFFVDLSALGGDQGPGVEPPGIFPPGSNVNPLGLNGEIVLNDGVDLHGAVIEIRRDAILGSSVGSRAFVRNVTIRVDGARDRSSEELSRGGRIGRLGLSRGATLTMTGIVRPDLFVWNGGRVVVGDEVTSPLTEVGGPAIFSSGRSQIGVFNGGEIEFVGASENLDNVIALTHTRTDGPVPPEGISEELLSDPVFQRPPRLLAKDTAVIRSISIFQGGEVTLRDRALTMGSLRGELAFVTGIDRTLLRDGVEDEIAESVRPKLRLEGGRVVGFLSGSRTSPVLPGFLANGPLDFEIVGDDFSLDGMPIALDGERTRLGTEDLTFPLGLLSRDLVYIAPDGFPAYLAGGVVLNWINSPSSGAPASDQLPQTDDDVRVFLVRSDVASVEPRSAAELALIDPSPRGLLSGESMTLRVPPEFEDARFRFAYPPVVLLPGSSLTVDGALIEGVVTAGGGELVLKDGASIAGRFDSDGNLFGANTFPGGGGVVRFTGESVLRTEGASPSILVEMRDRSRVFATDSSSILRMFDQSRFESSGSVTGLIFGYAPAEIQRLAQYIAEMNIGVLTRTEAEAILRAEQDSQTPFALISGGEVAVLTGSVGSTAAIRGGTPNQELISRSPVECGTYIIQGTDFLVDGEPVTPTRARREVLDLDRSTVVLSGTSNEDIAFEVDVTVDRLILEAPGAFFPIADFSGDEIVNISDLFAFIAALGEQDGAADVDGSGVVNMSDLFAYVEAFTSLEN